jgi:hypothetical protein
MGTVEGFGSMSMTYWDRDIPQPNARREIWLGIVVAIGLLFLMLTLSSCSGQSTQIVLYTPIANSCEKVSAYEWNNAGTAFLCFDKDSKPIGMVSGTAQSPLDLFSSYSNAAILGAAIPLTAGLLMPSTNVTTGRP